MVVLRRLGDAGGGRVRAVVAGSAVNQDGRSAGLTAPSGPAQAAVVRAALADAGLAPDDVDAVEAHGTGTALGDPIELHALAEVFAGRARPLWVGSVKSNLGHAEAAAGMAGLLKAVLMLEQGAVPASLHFERLNPHIELGGVDIRVPTRLEPVAPKAVGVSSFGFSGTNAHLVLRAAPAVTAPMARGAAGRAAAAGGADRDGTGGAAAGLSGSAGPGCGLAGAGAHRSLAPGAAAVAAGGGGGRCGRWPGGTGGGRAGAGQGAAAAGVSADRAGLGLCRDGARAAAGEPRCWPRCWRAATRCWGWGGRWPSCSRTGRPWARRGWRSRPCSRWRWGWAGSCGPGGWRRRRCSATASASMRRWCWRGCCRWRTAPG